MHFARLSWYCIRSHQKHEHIATAHLNQLPGVEALNPQLRFVRSTKRGPVWFTESLFPNYLFCRFVADDLLDKIRYSPGVNYILHFGGRMPTIPDQVIHNLVQELAAQAGRVFTDIPDQGEEVEIAEGPFEGAKAAVARVLPAKQRVELLLDIMGREVTAELSLSSILFRRNHAANMVLGHVPATSDRFSSTLCG